MKKILLDVCVCVGLLVVAALVFIQTACTPGQAKSAVGIVTTVSAATCAELAVQPVPDWVTLACEAIGAGNALVDAGVFGMEKNRVRVTIPRVEWEALKAAGREDGGK